MRVSIQPQANFFVLILLIIFSPIEGRSGDLSELVQNSGPAACVKNLSGDQGLAGFCASCGSNMGSFGGPICAQLGPFLPDPSTGVINFINQGLNKVVGRYAWGLPKKYAEPYSTEAYGVGIFPFVEIGLKKIQQQAIETVDETSCSYCGSTQVDGEVKDGEKQENSCKLDPEGNLDPIDGTPKEVPTFLTDGSDIWEQNIYSALPGGKSLQARVGAIGAVRVFSKDIPLAVLEMGIKDAIRFGGGGVTSDNEAEQEQKGVAKTAVIKNGHGPSSGEGTKKTLAELSDISQTMALPVDKFDTKALLKETKSAIKTTWQTSKSIALQKFSDTKTAYIAAKSMMGNALTKVEGLTELMTSMTPKLGSISPYGQGKIMGKTVIKTDFTGKGTKMFNPFKAKESGEVEKKDTVQADSNPQPDQETPPASPAPGPRVLSKGEVRNDKRQKDRAHPAIAANAKYRLDIYIPVIGPLGINIGVKANAGYQLSQEFIMEMSPLRIGGKAIPAPGSPPPRVDYRAMLETSKGKLKDAVIGSGLNPQKASENLGQSAASTVYGAVGNFIQFPGVRAGARASLLTYANAEASLAAAICVPGVFIAEAGLNAALSLIDISAAPSAEFRTNLLMPDFSKFKNESLGVDDFLSMTFGLYRNTHVSYLDFYLTAFARAAITLPFFSHEFEVSKNLYTLPGKQVNFGDSNTLFEWDLSKALK